VAVAHAEHIIDPLEESRAMRDVRRKQPSFTPSIYLSISHSHAYECREGRERRLVIELISLIFAVAKGKPIWR
jgi:hypothetical protein